MKLNRGRGNASRQRGRAPRAAIRKRVVVLSLGILACLAYGAPAAGASGSASNQAAATAPPGAVAVPSLFTPKSRTYKNSRGVYTTTLYGETVNVQEADGTWKPISTSASAATARAGGPFSGAVTPDASVSSTASHDCALASNSPTTSICNASTDTVGYDGTNTDNSLVEFELKEALPTGANVLNAQLGMYLSSASTSTPVSVSAYAATKPWTLSATWNSYDGTDAWSSPGGDFSTTNAIANPSVTTPAGWKYWYPTQIVQEWVNGTLTNDGLLLADTTQKTTKDMLSFNSLDASSNKPFLTIAWTPRGQEDPAVYTMQPFPTDAGSTIKVNLASGDLFVNGSDLSVASAGPPLLAEHNYDSLNTEGGSVNPWYSLPGAEVYPDGSVGIGINRYDYAVFIRQPNGIFLTPRSIDATLCAVNGSTCTGNASDGSGAAYALTFNHNGNGPLYQQGYKLDFAANGGVLSDADPAGNTITYHYGSFGISSISDSHGHTFTRSFHELKSGFHVTSAWTESGAGNREVKYAYNSSDQLETYTDAEGHKTKYAYDEEGELKEITDPSGHVTKLTYESAHRIKMITGPEVNGAHPMWSYTYYEIGKAPAPCTASQKATVLTETNGSEEPPLTYCANVFDEVERVVGYSVIGQAGGYLVESEPLDEAATTNVSVDLASGNLSIGGPDLTIESEGEAEVGPMVLERFYNSQAAKSAKSIGPRWSWSTGPSLYLSNYGGMVVVHGRDGYAVALRRTSAGTYETPGEYEGTLTQNADGTFTLTNADAPTYNFNAAGMLTSQTPEGGEAETVSNTAVNGATVLHKLTAASGKYFEIGYGASGRVESVKGSAGESHYGYNGSGQLTSYTSPSGAKTEYGYSEAGYINKITTSEGTENIVTTSGKVSEVTSTPGEGPVSVTKYTYQAPQAPTCNPATDAGETIVTTAVTGEPEPSTETFCYNAAGEFTGPKESEAEEEEGTETPPEVPGETCTEDPELHKEDCALEEGAPEETEDLPKKDYGIADNNWLQGRGFKTPFNYLSESTITSLHVKKYRRTVPWNMVSEAEHNEEKPNENPGAAANLADVEEWIKRVKEAGAEPYVGFDIECPSASPWDDPRKLSPAEEVNDDHVCKEAPNKAQYKAAVEKFLKPTLKHAILGEVRSFEALNEPNNGGTNKSGEHVKPTWSATGEAYPGGPNGAKLAGEYWRALDDLCASKGCFVAAGDFLDSAMPNAWNKQRQGYGYFHQYVEGMGKAPKAYRWAWHAYTEGEQSYKSYRNHPKKWWKPFKLFQKAVDRVMEHAKYKSPNIWLTEQGVEYFLNEARREAWKHLGAGPYILRAFVEHGSQQLTRQLNPATKKTQISRFFYYSTRGAPDFDSGLLEPATLPKGVVPKHPLRPNHPRSIYGVYAKKTPRS
jgi:YD repeat-containing protein